MTVNITATVSAVANIVVTVSLELSSRVALVFEISFDPSFNLISVVILGLPTQVHMSNLLTK